MEDFLVKCACVYYLVYVAIVFVVELYTQVRK